MNMQKQKERVIAKEWPPVPRWLLPVLALLAFMAWVMASEGSTPYGGTPVSIPGTIEAEDYDLGGQNDAYFDVDAANQGGAYRPSESVDLGASGEGGFSVGWTASGEWMNYTVHVTQAGQYSVTSRVARGIGGSGSFRIEANGVDVTGTIVVDDTGGWGNWVDVISTAALTNGEQVLTVVIEDPDINLNRIEFGLIPAPDAPTGLGAVPGENAVSLSWDAIDGSAGYTVKRSDTSGGPYSVLGTTSGIAYLDTVPAGQTYFYVVSAFNATGEGEDSSEASAAPFEPPPLFAEIQEGMGITWHASNRVIYQVQWAEEDLGTNTVWNNMGESISGKDEMHTVFTTNGSRVFRVLSIQ